jgi:hypothetical protein
MLGTAAVGALGVASAAVGWRLVRRRDRDPFAGIVSERRVAGAGPRGALGVVGDSLTFERIDDLVAQLREAGWGPIRADGRPGRRCTVDVAMAQSGRSVVRRWRTDGFHPAVWLVALGQNDTESVADEADARRIVAAVLDEIGDTPTVWVDVWTVGETSRWALVGAAIAAEAAARPHVRVAGWASVASAHPEWFVADGIHNTPEGARERNRFLVASLTV